MIIETKVHNGPERMTMNMVILQPTAKAVPASAGKFGGLAVAKCLPITPANVPSSTLKASFSLASKISKDFHVENEIQIMTESAAWPPASRAPAQSPGG